MLAGIVIMLNAAWKLLVELFGPQRTNTAHGALHKRFLDMTKSIGGDDAQGHIVNIFVCDLVAKPMNESILCNVLPNPCRFLE
jgi:hypothetical protein